MSIVGSLAQDLRSGWRWLARQWRSTFAAIVAIALGISVAVVIVGLVRGVLLKPLPYREPDRLAMIWNQHKTSSMLDRTIVTPGDLTIWRAQASAFSDLAAVELWNANLTARMDLVSADRAERLRGAYVTPNFFDLLGVHAVIGRTAVDATEEGHVVVLSHALWRRRFGADPSIVGREIALAIGRDRAPRPFRVAGVLPLNVPFTYPRETEVWLPRSWRDTEAAPRPALLYWVVARLRPGMTVSQAEREMVALSERAAREFPKERYRERTTVRLEPVHEHVAGQVRPLMLLLSALTAMVLLIACVNVSTLLLARTASRARDVAIRSALGAGRGRLFRQLFTEGLLLSTIGGVVGVGGAIVVFPLFRRLLPLSMPRVDGLQIDGWVLGSAVLAVALASTAANVVPSWMGTRLALRQVLTMTGASSASASGVTRWARLMIGLQVAALCVLLVCVGLLVQSLSNLYRVDLGYESAGVLTMEMRALGPKARDTQRLAQFQDAVLARIRAIPGVTEASLTSSVPMRGTDWTVVVTREGDASHGGTTKMAANLRQIDPRYFAVLRIPLRAGRVFSPADTAGSLPVAIVSEGLAARLFPGERAVGKRLAGTAALEIVGVVGDVRHVRVDEPAKPALYVPRAQDTSELMCLVVRSDRARADVMTAVLAAIRDIDPDQPVEGATTLDGLVGEGMSLRAFYTGTTALFGLVSLVLAMVGVFGVMAYAVNERVSEIGIRTAVGASAGQILSLLIRQELRPVIIGLVVGATLAFFVSRLLRAFLFEASTIDPSVYAATAVLILTTAFVACYVPARRGVKQDVVTALRRE